MPSRVYGQMWSRERLQNKTVMNRTCFSEPLSREFSETACLPERSLYICQEYRESYKAVQAVNKTQLAALRLFCEFSSSPPRKMTAIPSTLNEHSRKFREVVTIASHAFIDVGWNSLSVWYCFDLVFFVARGAMQTCEVESCEI